MKLTVKVLKTGEISTTAIDLTGDAWSDYLYFLDEARKAEAKNDLHATNRFLRAALGNLISHLDGVVSGLYRKLTDKGVLFESQKRTDGKHCTLKGQILDLKRYAERHLGTRLPYLNLKVKLLRDILMHPSITKENYDHVSNKQIKLSESDLFALSVKTLSAEGTCIGNWLDKLCSTYKFTRIHDTKAFVERYADALGPSKDLQRI